MCNKKLFFFFTEVRFDVFFRQPAQNHRDNFFLQKFNKIKFEQKMDKNHLQELKNLWKTIFSSINSILVENYILKKKSPNLPKIAKIPAKNENLKMIIWAHGFDRPEIVQDRSRLCPIIYSRKVFFPNFNYLTKYSPPPKKKTWSIILRCLGLINSSEGVAIN